MINKIKNNSTVYACNFDMPFKLIEINIINIIEPKKIDDNLVCHTFECSIGGINYNMVILDDGSINNDDKIKCGIYNKEDGYRKVKYYYIYTDKDILIKDVKYERNNLLEEYKRIIIRLKKEISEREKRINNLLETLNNVDGYEIIHTLN